MHMMCCHVDVVLQKRKKMNKSRGSAADKWTDEETSILISVLYDDARKSRFKGYAISGPRLIEVRKEFFEKIGNRDKFDDERIK